MIRQLRLTKNLCQKLYISNYWELDILIFYTFPLWIQNRNNKITLQLIICEKIKFRKIKICRCLTPQQLKKNWSLRGTRHSRIWNKS